MLIKDLNLSLSDIPEGFSFDLYRELGLLARCLLRCVDDSALVVDLDSCQIVSLILKFRWNLLDNWRPHIFLLDLQSRSNKNDLRRCEIKTTAVFVSDGLVIRSWRPLHTKHVIPLKVAICANCANFVTSVDLLDFFAAVSAIIEM